MDPILLESGVVSSVDIEVTEEGRAALNQEVGEFVRAGGVLTWEMWRSLSTVTREAFVLAAESVRREQAVVIARSIMSQHGGAEFLLDDGDAHVASVLDQAADAIADKRNGKPSDVKSMMKGIARKAMKK